MERPQGRRKRRLKYCGKANIIRLRLLFTKTNFQIKKWLLVPLWQNGDPIEGRFMELRNQPQKLVQGLQHMSHLSRSNLMNLRNLYSQQKKTEI